MNIKNKLFIVIISFSFFLITTTILVVQWSIDKGMIEYVNKREINALQPVIQSLEKHYQNQNSWDLLLGNHQIFIRLLSDSLDKGEFAFERPQPPRREQRRPKRPFRDEFQGDNSPRNFNDPQRPFIHQPPHIKPERAVNLPSYALLGIKRNYIVGDYPKAKDYHFSELKVDNIIVGYLAISKRNELTEHYDLDFISQQHSKLWWVALFIMLLVIIVTLPLARHLVEPIKKLAEGMHKLTQGNYQQKISLTRKDELGDLSRDFNELAITLEANETARKRWLANISHELRTPVAILKGELEAMIDGIRSLSLENVESAHQEMKHLEKLIDDLHMLTSTDIGGMKYRKEPLNISEFLIRESKKHKGYLLESNLDLKVNIEHKPIMVLADSTRLSQLLDNLINNCVKYANTGMVVEISVTAISTSVVKVVIEDDGEGVDDNHLEYLFEYLYRIEDSRNRNTGGTGLGLSICSEIVKGHEGAITATKSSLGGLAVCIELPIYNL